MRIPLIRKGGDDTPIAWWEHLFLPLLLLSFGLAALVSIPVSYCWRWKTILRERRLREQMAAQNRIVDWREVAAGLSEGTGTLIVEHRSLKGWPVRGWWTEEDIVASTSIAVPLSFQMVLRMEPDELEDLTEFACSFRQRYLDPPSGIANLTTLPAEASADNYFRKTFPTAHVLALLNGNRPVLWITASLCPTDQATDEES